MSASTGYTSLPGSWGADLQKQSFVTINGVTVPAVPAGSCLLLLVGLVMWSVGMLQARSTVDGIFSDMGLEAASLEHLKATVLASVIVLLVLVLLVLAANVWLEVERGATAGGQAAAPAPAVRAYGVNAFRINVGNWMMLLIVALAMAGSITWLSTMSAALSATQQAGGSPWGVAAAAAAANRHSVLSTVVQLPADVKAAAQATVVESTTTSSSTVPVKSVGMASDTPEMGQLWAASASTATHDASNGVCPPGCVDLGLIAQVLGLPWQCFCQVWLLKDLEAQLHKVVAQLWVAVVGALLLFASTSWLYGYLAAQGAHAARDLRELLAGYPHEQHQHHQGAGGVLAPAGAAAGAGSAEGV